MKVVEIYVFLIEITGGKGEESDRSKLIGDYKQPVRYDYVILASFVSTRDDHRHG